MSLLFARRVGRRPLRLVVISAFTAVGAFSGCGGDGPSEPEADCNWMVGQNFVELQPAPVGAIVEYGIDVGESIQIGASVHRVDAGVRVFNPQQGWYCVVAASSPVSAVVGFTTPDNQIVRLRPGGWIDGLMAGTATVTASSMNPAAALEFGVMVYRP